MDPSAPESLRAFIPPKRYDPSTQAVDEDYHRRLMVFQELEHEERVRAQRNEIARVTIGWRIARSVLLATGRASEGKMTERRPSGLDPFYHFTGQPILRDERMRILDPDTKKIRMDPITGFEREEDAEGETVAEGVGILPPHFTQGDSVQKWHDAAVQVAYALAIFDCAYAETAAALLGNKAFAAENFPTKDEILALEASLVDQTSQKVIDKSTQDAIRFLKQEFQLTATEIDDVLGMARDKIRTIVGKNVEENRALMVLRLEAVATSARRSGSLNGELRALKQLSVVQGLHSEVEVSDAEQDAYQAAIEIEVKEED